MAGAAPWTRPVQGLLEGMRSRARWQWRLAHSRLALPRSDGGVHMLKQSIRPLALGRLEHEGRGSFYRPLNQLGIAAGRTARDPLLNVRDHDLKLLVAQTRKRIHMLDFLLSRHEQDRELAVDCRLRPTHFGKRVIAVHAPVAQKARDHFLAELVTRAGLPSAGVA
jgi:hypothetical protein